MFIALHGRPGEDGQLQKRLNELSIPYNGSDVECSYLCMNKYLTNQKLKKNDIKVADQFLVYRDDFLKNSLGVAEELEKFLKYPIIAKPVDDGCSAGIEKIISRDDFLEFGK